MEESPRVVFLTGAGASKPLGLPTMADFLHDGFYREGDTWEQAAGYLSYQWARANVGFHDFEYVYTLADVLSRVTLNDPLSFGLTTQAPTILTLPQGGQLPLNVDALRDGAKALRERLRDHVHKKLMTLDAGKAAKLYGGLLSPILQRLRTATSVSLFTTNYDRAVESIFANGLHTEAFSVPVALRRGFVAKSSYQSSLAWDASDYDVEPTAGDITLRLFKLHGSLNWRATSTGVVETEADEYSEDRSTVIYPLKDLKSHLEEPFATLFRY